MIITPLQNATRLRSTHDTSLPYLSLHDIGAKIYGGEVWTAPATTAYNRQGDQWLKVESINGVPTSGWVAITHNGGAICKELVDTPTVFEPVTATLYDVNGTARHYVLTPKQ
jgi:hypothetical protein